MCCHRGRLKGNIKVHTRLHVWDKCIMSYNSLNIHFFFIKQALSTLVKVCHKMDKIKLIL